MGIVRLGSNGEVEVLEPGLPEKQTEAHETLIETARALDHAAAARDYAEAMVAAQTRKAETEIRP